MADQTRGAQRKLKLRNKKVRSRWKRSIKIVDMGVISGAPKDKAGGGADGKGDGAEEEGGDEDAKEDTKAVEERKKHSHQMLLRMRNFALTSVVKRKFAELGSQDLADRERIAAQAEKTRRERVWYLARVRLLRLHVASRRCSLPCPLAIGGRCADD